MRLACVLDMILMLLVSSQTSLARMSHTQLMQILSDDSNSDAIAWMPHGLTFVIHNRDKLISEILPHYFGEKIKFTSFTRKLKRWSFVRFPTGDGDAAFYNKNFRRVNPSIQEMKPEQAGTPTKLPLDAMSFCGYHPTNTLLRESIPEKIDGKPLCGSKPLKKRPVDETSLHTESRQGRVLPEPKLITVMKRTHPSILGNCCPTDIERQGLARKINHTSTHQKDVKREALFKLLLQRQLLREGSKAKKHFDHHYG